MAVTPSKSGLPTNTRGSHTQPAPTPRPTNTNTPGARRNMAGRKGRSPLGGKDK